MKTQAGEWPATLDIPALLASGFRPTPFRQFVLKLTARCDLACGYCYVFASADQGWRTKPARMPSAVVERTARRIARYAERHSLPSVNVALHGGEPLLIGADGVDSVAAMLRRVMPGDVRVDLRIQTNGRHLDDDMLSILAAHQIRVGISLDGDASAHDRHRRRPDGQSSYAETSYAIRRLTALHPDLFGGLLCAVDVSNDPLVTYRALREYAPPVIDLLLPHATWSLPPAGVPDPAAPNRSTPYGDWLVTVFDHWYPIAPQEPTIRLFDELMRLLLGGESQVETIGLSPATVVVIDTDGSIEQVDTLRAAFAGAAALGLSVDRDDFETAHLHPGIVARQLRGEALCTSCRACPFHTVCGAGYYPHRYRPGSGFLNPSVYCADLYRLISRVHQRVTDDLQWVDENVAGARERSCLKHGSSKIFVSGDRSGGWGDR